MERLYDKLLQFCKEDYYPMHMPGHKRNTAVMSMINPYALDITEIEGFDNLHQAEGILMQLSNRLAKLYHSGAAYPLVNGSTAGILAGISAVVKRGDKILMARNCHKSVYHAVLVNELEPIYIYPETLEDNSLFGGILPEKIEEMLISYPEIKLVVVTSPTYEGVVSDIRTIANVVHRHGARLLVDEAHGAHFGFHEAFPESAVTCGADLVIQSLHKTLPALTQTAVLHLNSRELRDEIGQYLSIYQTSSPSYLLMAGIDGCISMLEENAWKLFATFSERLKSFNRSVEKLKNLKLLNNNIIGDNGVYDLDPSKLTIMLPKEGFKGRNLYKRLYTDYHIVMEMEAKDYVLGMTSICDTEEGFQRLSEALLQIDSELVLNEQEPEKTTRSSVYLPIQAMLPYEAVKEKTEVVSLSDSRNRISASFVSIFPPGAPMLVPGEIIDDLFLKHIDAAAQAGLAITGLSGAKKDSIRVIL